MRKAALQKHTPSVVALSRQNLPQLSGHIAESVVQKGAYVLSGESKGADLVIFSNGGELHLATQLAAMLEPKFKVAVVSTPCWEWFFAQDKAYQDEVLMRQVKARISIEAGVSLGWERFVGTDGLIIALDEYGQSAPAEKLADVFGFTPEKIYKKLVSHWPQFKN